MKQCARCSTENADFARYCENCGLELDDGASAGKAGFRAGEDAAMEGAAPTPQQNADSPEESADAVGEAPRVYETEVGGFGGGASSDGFGKAGEPAVRRASEEDPYAGVRYATDEPAVRWASEAPAPTPEPVRSDDFAARPAQPGPDPAAVAAAAAAAAAAANAAAEASCEGDAGIPNPSASAARAQSAPKAPVAYSCDGVLGRAWKDVRSSQGWFGKSVLLALISFVPILNFVVYGYCLRWGRMACFPAAQDDPLPPVAVKGDFFKYGFFSVVLNAIFGIIAGLLYGIPYLGIVVMVACVFFLPLLYLCLQRMNLLNSFREAFSLKTVWEKYRRNVGGSMALAWIPSLIAVAAVLAVCVAACIVAGVSVLGFSSAMAYFRYFGMALGMIVLVVALFVMQVVVIAASLVTYRAFGYWTVRVAPEWVDETYRAAGMVPPAR